MYVQSVSATDKPFLWKLIDACEARTFAVERQLRLAISNIATTLMIELWNPSNVTNQYVCFFFILQCVAFTSARIIYINQPRKTYLDNYHPVTFTHCYTTPNTICTRHKRTDPCNEDNVFRFALHTNTSTCKQLRTPMYTATWQACSTSSYRRTSLKSRSICNGPYSRFPRILP